VYRTQGSVAVLLLLVVGYGIVSCSGSESGSNAPEGADLDRLSREARTAPTAEEALDRYRHLERAAEEADRPFAVIAARLGRAGVFVGDGRLDSAEIVLRQAADGATTIGHNFNAALAYDGLATVFERRGWIDSALVALRRAEEFAAKRGEADRLQARIRERREELSRLEPGSP
jgi:hypothetical protein